MFALGPHDMFILGFGMPGVQELIIIAVIVLILFGSRLPSVMRNLGRGVTEFKKGINDIGDEDVAGGDAGKGKEDV